MASFGGLGGVMGGRERDPTDLFEAAVERCMGARLRSEGLPPRDDCREFLKTSLGARLWGSLANMGWRHENGDDASYSWRAAGDMIAAIIGDGDYLDWYMSANDGVADDEVCELLAAEGWRPEDD